MLIRLGVTGTNVARRTITTCRAAMNIPFVQRRRQRRPLCL
ncbi:MAG: hypothetical protein E5Y32_05255 [Mesorhizobium sp.]|nr:hypothetical protein [Mesorhizobium sp. M5C.F.Ca.IN.020.29.1.1]RWM76923.1 MAG: hypothetical protein EOR81_20870 [Mesorhizobium sp.]RUV54551.1 hypothetical protein EOA85_24510 [Mesorhizobium sp. M5C.F.Ca.IN.020.29.1.1]RWN53633.1 MAG: hypothetical protein EOS00_30600 [Mesorhizobium sp.]RWN62168.1 MAG: hypothetical protein EOR99_29775 [Mesorhizobium sp.]RWO76026.1 MAG: hypothetical protein EOS18_27400 [Mesorhizobium sp.]